MTPDPDGGPLPAPIGRALEPFYRAAIALRNTTFDRGWRITRLPFPVISVGNLSVGGTGKTPMVMWIARTLAAAGIKPAIALRGYMTAAGATSDEAAEYAAAMPGVPLAIGAKRAETLAALRRDHEFDCALLDDGFQHRFLARDLDIVLIDSTRDLYAYAERCLPAGWLREPASSLKRANFIVYTRFEDFNSYQADDAQWHIEQLIGESKPFATCAHEWSAVRLPDRDAPLEWLRGKRVVPLAAIGNPSAFVLQVEHAGAEVPMWLTRRDHHVWNNADLAELRQRLAQIGLIDAILATEKDWVKLRALDLSSLPAPIVRPKLELRFSRGEEALRRMIFTAAAHGDA